MIGILAALTPVFAVILIGFVARQGRLVPETFWQPAERFTFYVFFPALLVTSIARADFAGFAVAPMLTASVGGILVVVLACLLPLRRWLGPDGPALTSLVQSSVRPNVYVALAAAAALYGAPGVALASLCLAVVVPVVNVVSVLALVRWGQGQTPVSGWRGTLWPVAGNPLIVACLIGLAVNITGLGLPPLIEPTLDILGRASLPIGLLAVGAGLELRAVRAAGRVVATASALKLIVLPVVTLSLCLALGADDLARRIAVLLAAVPVSASAYVMARQMGGDTAVMAGAITATTLAAAITMPLILFVI
ncbi:MAG: AEC family transporter [Rhodospirillales bacterium]|nr:MAG: AEC family transporter [Rhodospirillales bacterium]